MRGKPTNTSRLNLQPAMLLYFRGPRATCATARFEQEARAIAALNHPQIHDIGPDYLVLEYVEEKHVRMPLGLRD